MNQEQKNEDWEIEFFTKFGANTIWTKPSRENVETILDIKSFISNLLSQQKEKLIKEIEEIITTQKQCLKEHEGREDNNFCAGFHRGKIEGCEEIIDLIKKI